MANEHKNSVSKFPEFYFVRHMQAGLCGYEDETVLVDTEAVKKLCETFNGKPVYIEHKDVDFDTMKKEAVGYVVDTWLDGSDGWAWSKIMITDDEGHDAIVKDWAVSNAYIPTEWGGGGTKNNLPYDREILNGYFTHLAIVPNPRYEDAKIYTPDEYQARNAQLLNSLANSKPTEKKGFSMIFWKKEKVSDSAQADFVEYTNAKGVTVTKSIEEMTNALEAEAKQKEVLAKTVMVNGKEMSVSDMVKAYEKLNAKKNESQKDDEKENEEDEDEMENETIVVRDDFVNEDDEDEDEKENEDEDDGEKKNAKVDHFKTLSNASRKNSAKPMVIDTRSAQLARSDKYGS